MGTNHSPREQISSESKDEALHEEELPIRRPIPQNWIEHHGFDLETFRRNDQILLQLYREADGVESNSSKKNANFPFFFLSTLAKYM